MSYLVIHTRQRAEVEEALPPVARVVSAHVASPTEPPDWNLVVEADDRDAVRAALLGIEHYSRDYLSYADAVEAAAAAMN